MITILMIAKILLLLSLGVLCILVAMRICYQAGRANGAAEQAEIIRLHNLPQMRERDSMNPVHIRL